MFPAAWARRHARERLDLEADEIDGGHYITLSRRESSPSGLQHTPRAFDDRYEADPAPQRWASGTVVRAGNERWSTNGAQRVQPVESPGRSHEGPGTVTFDRPRIRPAVSAADVFSPDAGAQHDAPKRTPGCPGRLRRLERAVVTRLVHLPQGGSRQEGDAVPRPILDRLTGDLAAVVDVVRRAQLAGVLGGEVVEIPHDIVLPDESPADGEIFRVRHAHDLARIVDAESLAEWIIVQCAEILDLPRMLREKRPRTERSTVGGRAIGEAHDMASSVDRHRRVPGDAAQVSDLDRPSLLP